MTISVHDIKIQLYDSIVFKRFDPYWIIFNECLIKIMKDVENYLVKLIKLNNKNNNKLRLIFITNTQRSIIIVCWNKGA